MTQKRPDPTQRYRTDARFRSLVDMINETLPPELTPEQAGYVAAVAVGEILRECCSRCGHQWRRLKAEGPAEFCPECGVDLD